MKHTLLSKLLIIGVLVSSFINAEAQNVETTIKSVTVYRKGAMVERTGTINLKKGSNTLYLNNLSTELDPNTLRIGINNKSAKILSVKHEIVVATDENFQKMSIADDKRIAIIKDSLAYLKAKLSVINEEEKLIQSNRSIRNPQHGVTTAELKAMSEFYKKELTDIANRKININKKIVKYNSEFLTLTQKKHNSQSNLQHKDSRVKLIIESDNTLSSVPVSLSYLIFSASWEPFYEIRVDKTNQPLDLVYGAHIKQYSSEDWNSVKLNVSTGDPSIGNDAPEFLSMYLPPERRNTNTKKWAPPTSNLIYGIVTDEEYEPLIGASIVEKGTNNYAIADLNGKFQMTMENTNNQLVVSYIGYISQTVNPTENMQVVLQEDQTNLEEAVVIGYGIQKKSDITGSIVTVQTETRRKGKYNEPEKNIPLELSDTQTATEFKIDIPYTIPSDDNVYDVSMLTYHIDADYRYVSQPRQSSNVFVLANILDLSRYPLLKGNAYVYFDNVYQGECEIAPNFAVDTFSISVGKDNGISINRQAVKEFTSKKIIGTTYKVTKCFEITIKNNKNESVNLTVDDQYPLPKYSDIKVELTDNGGATVDTEKGKLTWMLKLEPQEKKVLRFSYEVKYPKSYNFAVE